jgi:hypothetical protein
MGKSSRQVHPQALPGYENAVIQDEKLRDYVLNPSHVWGKSKGSDKARVFRSVLGYDRSDWKELKEAILGGLPFHEALPAHEDEHGKRYKVILSLMGPNGTLQKCSRLGLFGLRQTIQA